MLTRLCHFLMLNPRRLINYHHPAPRRSRGQVIVIFGLALVVLMLFVGLALDAGALYVSYGHLKRAVDSASVAAANAYRGTQVFPVGTPIHDIMAANLAKITGAAVETIALDGLNIPAGTTYGVKTGQAQVQVFICDSNGDGYRDGDTGDTSGVTLPAVFFQTCPHTDPHDPTIQGRKLVYVQATLNSPLYFLQLIFPNQPFVPLTTYTIAEAAPLDLVIAIDTSGSMGDATSPALDPSNANPTVCNSNDSCQPLKDAKQAAATLVRTLYNGYDHVDIIIFDQYARSVTMDSTGNPFASVDTAYAYLTDATQHKVILHYDAPLGKRLTNWTENGFTHTRLYNPMNPEDMDGDGLDSDDQVNGPRANLPYGTNCPDLTILDNTNPFYALMAYQLRWWDGGDPKAGIGNPYGAADSPLPPAAWINAYGGAPCDSKMGFDSMNWLGVLPPNFDAAANDTAIRNWLMDPSINFDQNRKALAYYVSDTTHTVDPTTLSAASIAVGSSQESYGFQRFYHDVAGRLLSHNATCTGCAIRTAFNDFNAGGRNDATWVMVMLSDGAANVTDQPSQFPSFFSNTTSGWDITLDTKATPEHTQFANGFCEGYLGDGNLWSHDCEEQNPPSTYNSGGTYSNVRYCIYEDPAKCPPNYGKTTVTPLNVTALHDVTNRMKYGPVQYAMDMIDMLALQVSTNTHEKMAPFGDKKVGVYTIAFGSKAIATSNTNGIPEGEELLRYIAAVGDDGNRDTNPCVNGLGVPVTSQQDCGNYYYASTTANLVTAFSDIAKRIQTKISY
jgi:hypothetical protein